MLVLKMNMVARLRFGPLFLEVKLLSLPKTLSDRRWFRVTPIKFPASRTADYPSNGSAASWKRGSVRFVELRRRGIGRDLAAQSTGSPHCPRRLSISPVSVTRSVAVFAIVRSAMSLAVLKGF